ncbi:MAG: DUF429 domain-containing protein [Gemmatimonadales bacterium]
MTTLLVGFDSAWTAKNAGAVVGVLRGAGGELTELGLPVTADFSEAAIRIGDWKEEYKPARTLVMLDQPTIVPNTNGQRPVENLVGSPVSRRYGGVQPAHRGRLDMFGDGAPVWPFMKTFGGAHDPRRPLPESVVLETYPVLAMIALEWVQLDKRQTGRLPKYNPGRKKTFSLADWQFVCASTAEALRSRQLTGCSTWLDDAGQLSKPGKAAQDKLDALVCLLVALHLAEGSECLMIGDVLSGYMVVPDSDPLRQELTERCLRTKRVPEEWVHRFRLARE